MKNILSTNINPKVFFSVIIIVSLVSISLIVYAKTLTIGETGDILYIISKVGIGTATPTLPLEVVGNVGWSGVLQKGSVPWSRLISFPSDCPSGQYSYGIGGSLRCSTPPTGGGGAASCPAGQVIRSFDLATGSVVCVSGPKGPKGPRGPQGVVQITTCSPGAICRISCSYYQDDVGEPCFMKPPNYEYYKVCQSNGTWSDTTYTHCVYACTSSPCL